MPCLNTVVVSETINTLTITPNDWDSETKIATLSADWALENMSANVSPDIDYIDLYKSYVVRGVYCTQILNGYVQFKTGADNVMTENIVMYISAFDDGQNAIVNADVILESDSGVQANIEYNEEIDGNNEVTLFGIVPKFVWEVPPYDEDGNEIITIGKWATAFTNKALLQEIYFINNVKTITQGLSSAGIEKIYLGKQLTAITYDAFQNCASLKEVVFEPNRSVLLSIQNISNYRPFYNCTAIEHLVIPDLVSINGGSFANCTGIETIRYESSYALSNVFPNCTGLQEMTFTKATPCTVSTPAGVFNNATHLYVPYDSLTAYSSANNWTAYEQYLYGFGTFITGASLPGTTTDELWTLVWYGTKADLIAGTNAITVAPSAFDNDYGEIYCVKTAVI